MKELKQAFTISLPICFGYLFLGIAFALLMSQEGFPAWASIFQVYLFMLVPCNLPLSHV